MTEPYQPRPPSTCCGGRRRCRRVARTGLGFTQSLYEQERFEEVLKVAADIRAAAIEEAEADALFDEWLSDASARASRAT